MTPKTEHADLAERADEAAAKVKDLLHRINNRLEYGPPERPKNGDANGHGHDVPEVDPQQRRL